MTESELYHYGVKGMKWGVRKEQYKSMNRADRKRQRKAYSQTPEGKIERATKTGTYLSGKKEDGKPAFLMTGEEMEAFDYRYEQRRKALVNRYKSATDAKTKDGLFRQLNKMEQDYMDIVEQDFWYSDDF